MSRLTLMISGIAVLAGVIGDLLPVHVGDPDEEPDSKLILLPVRRFYRLFEGSQQWFERKEPLIKRARPERVRWVFPFSFVREPLQDSFEQGRRDLFD